MNISIYKHTFFYFLTILLIKMLENLDIFRYNSFQSRKLFAISIYRYEENLQIYLLFIYYEVLYRIPTMFWDYCIEIDNSLHNCHITFFSYSK